MSNSFRDYYINNFFDDNFDLEIIESNVKELCGEEITGINIISTSLILENKISIRHYFKIDEYSITDFSFTLDEQELSAYEKEGYVFIDIENILINDVCKKHILIVTNKETEESFSVVYSVSSYIADVLERPDTDIKLLTLSRSLYAYYKAAIEYENSEK